MKIFGSKSVFVALLFASACAAGGAVAQSSGNYTPPNPYDPARFNTWRPRTANGNLSIQDSSGNVMGTWTDAGTTGNLTTTGTVESANKFQCTAGNNCTLQASGGGQVIIATGTGSAVLGATATTFTIDDNSGNVIATFTDGGTVGDLSVTRDISNINGGFGFKLNSSAQEIISGSDSNNWIGLGRSLTGDINLQSHVSDGSTAVGVYSDNTVALSNATSKLFDFRNNGTSKVAIGVGGTPNLYSTSGDLTIGANAAANTVLQLQAGSAGGARTTYASVDLNGLSFGNGAGLISGTTTAALEMKSGSGQAVKLTSQGTGQVTITSSNAATITAANGITLDPGSTFNTTIKGGTGANDLIVGATGGVTVTGLTCSGANTCGAQALSAGSATHTVPSGCRALCTDTTAAAAIRCSVSATTLTFTGTGSDVINWMCM